MKKYSKGFVLKKPLIIAASVVAFLLLIIVLVISRFKSWEEKHFESTELRISNKIVETGYNKYISSDSEQYAESYERLMGRPLTDDEKEQQMRLLIKRLGGGMTTNYFFSGKYINICDSWSYYDSEMNELNSFENDALMFDRKDEEGKGHIIYSYESAEFSSTMQSIKEQYDDKDNVYITVKGLYLKDFTFVPKSLTYYELFKDGKRSEVKTIYNESKSDAEMESDGYTFMDIEETFDVNSNSGSFTYVSTKYDEAEQIVQKYVQEYKNAGKPESMRKILSNSPFTFELIDIREVSPAEGVKYYVVTYNRKPAVSDILFLGTD